MAEMDEFEDLGEESLGQVVQEELAALIPWSAINLADYYVVCRGVYSIEHIFSLHGVYGRYRWRTIAIYLLSILIQIPFVRLSFYTGSLARVIGADIAWLPATLVPALLYCLTERPVSLPEECDTLNERMGDPTT